MEYTIFYRPSLLMRSDTVVFQVKGRTMVYQVHPCCLCFEGQDNNDTIFRVLDLRKDALSTQVYGYRNEGGDWPQYRHNDYEAATKMVNYLFDQIAFGEGDRTEGKLPLINMVREDMEAIMVSMIAGHPFTFQPENRKFTNFLIRRGIIEKKTFKVLDRPMLQALQLRAKGVPVAVRQK